MKRHLQSNREPERVRVPFVLEECEAQPRGDGQTEYTAIAQYFGSVNDRGMRFKRGSFKKTIREGVKAGKILINDSHRHSVDATLGKVIEAKEVEEGVWYRGLLSVTAGKVVTLMREKTITENSIEFFSIREKCVDVPFEEFPKGAFIWDDQRKANGDIEIREILEVSWNGLALCPFSAQGRAAVLEINCAIPFQDYPVAGESTAWDPDGAKKRLTEWAGRQDHGDVVNHARLSLGYLARGPIHDGIPSFLGQIVDIIDGQPVVIPDALESAMESIGSVDALPGPDVVHAATTRGRYLQKCLSSPCNLEKDDVASIESTEAPAGPADPPPTNETVNDAAAMTRKRDRELKLMSLRLKVLAAERGEVNVTTGAGEQPA